MTAMILSTALAAVAVVFLVYRRAASRHACLAVDTKTHPLDWMTSLEHQPLDDDWQTMTVSDLTAAEDALDQLESQGIAERGLQPVGDGKFVVRWRKSA